MLFSERDRAKDRLTGLGRMSRGATSSTRPPMHRKSKKQRSPHKYLWTMSADKSLRDISMRNSRTSRCVTWEIFLCPQKLTNSCVTLRYVAIVLVEYRWQVIHSMNLAARAVLFRWASAETRFDSREKGKRCRFSMTLRNIAFLPVDSEYGRSQSYIPRLLDSQWNGSKSLRAGADRRTRKNQKSLRTVSLDCFRLIG